MKLDLRAYRPAGLLALRPEALGQDYPGYLSDGKIPTSNGAAVVRIDGPLIHGHGYFMCYEDILACVKSAAESDAHTIVLKIDSPGGDVAGVLDTAREIRKVASAANKRLLAYSEGVMASAAYALGCAASEITVSATACIGSIGVIEAMVDATAADKSMGIKWTLVTSGKLKGTGNPHAALTEDQAAEVQQHVDDMAAEFFGWVQESRGFDPAPLQAAVRIGRRAVTDKMADNVASWAEFLAGAEIAPTKEDTGDTDRGTSGASATVASMSLKAESDAEAAKKYLKKMAESEDEVESKRAKRALEAMDSDGDDEDKKKESKKAEAEEGKKAKAEDDAEGKKAESDDEEKKAEDDEAEAKATASLAQKFAKATQRIAALEAASAKSAKAEEAAKRDAIFASRPDLSKELIESLKDLPVARVKAVVDGIPKGRFVAGIARSAQDSAGGQVPTLGANVLDDMSVKMGLVKPTYTGVAWDGTRFQLGVPEVVDAAKNLKGGQ